MTDESAGELFALARDSFRGGQRSFQIQAFPFRMTPENMAKHRDSEHYAFWQMLKVGSDHFEVTKLPPKVDVCGKGYVFNADPKGAKFSPTEACPPYEVPENLKIAVAAKQAQDEALISQTVNRFAQEADRAAEEKRIAEEQRIAAETKAAEKQAAKQARAAQISEKLGVFGRVFGRDKKTSTPQSVAEAPPATADEASVTAFAPATPVPPEKPTANKSTAAVASPPPPPSTSPTAAAPTISQEMTPAIPSVGRFVKKNFLWVDEESESAADTPG